MSSDTEMPDVPPQEIAPLGDTSRIADPIEETAPHVEEGKSGDELEGLSDSDPALDSHPGSPQDQEMTTANTSAPQTTRWRMPRIHIALAMRIQRGQAIDDWRYVSTDFIDTRQGRWKPEKRCRCGILSQHARGAHSATVTGCECGFPFAHFHEWYDPLDQSPIRVDIMRRNLQTQVVVRPLASMLAYGKPHEVSSARFWPHTWTDFFLWNPDRVNDGPRCLAQVVPEGEDPEECSCRCGLLEKHSAGQHINFCDCGLPFEHTHEQGDKTDGRPIRSDDDQANHINAGVYYIYAEDDTWSAALQAAGDDDDDWDDDWQQDDDEDDDSDSDEDDNAPGDGGAAAGGNGGDDQAPADPKSPSTAGSDDGPEEGEVFSPPPAGSPPSDPDNLNPPPAPAPNPVPDPAAAAAPVVTQLDDDELPDFDPAAFDDIDLDIDMGDGDIVQEMEAANAGLHHLDQMLANGGISQEQYNAILPLHQAHTAGLQAVIDAGHPAVMTDEEFQAFLDGLTNPPAQD